MTRAVTMLMLLPFRSFLHGMGMLAATLEGWQKLGKESIDEVAETMGVPGAMTSSATTQAPEPAQFSVPLFEEPSSQVVNTAGKKEEKAMNLNQDLSGNLVKVVQYSIVSVATTPDENAHIIPIRPIDPRFEKVIEEKVKEEEERLNQVLTVANVGGALDNKDVRKAFPDVIFKELIGENNGNDKPGKEDKIYYSWTFKHRKIKEKIKRLSSPLKMTSNFVAFADDMTPEDFSSWITSMHAKDIEEGAPHIKENSMFSRDLKSFIRKNIRVAFIVIDRFSPGDMDWEQLQALATAKQSQTLGQIREILGHWPPNKHAMMHGSDLED